MVPPYMPYIPLRHPDDWLPIQSTRRTQSDPEIWLEWFEHDTQSVSSASVVPLLGKFARWLEAFRFRRRTKIRMIEKEIGC